MRDAVVQAWIDDDPDPATRAELEALLGSGDEAELRDRFSGPLRFGTAGLRGIVRAGPNGMNRAVVRRAAAGLAGYLASVRADGPVVIGYDARRGSTDFARDTAAVLAGAGRAALLLPSALPTPVLAFAVRHLDAAAGVMVTASHNPPQDNGYKVYLGDGAQIVPPADALIQVAIASIRSVRALPLSEDYTILGEEVLDAYLAAICAVPPAGPRELTVAYTALHGVGAEVARRAFVGAGFAEPYIVAEQALPDPAFPTVPFPNPEEPGAVDLLLALAAGRGADIAIANDPDADRCAVICGRMLRGDEVGVLLADALLDAGRTGTFATTIVSSSMLRSLCLTADVPYAETLTGFKWIVRAPEQTGVPLAFGYEEALGYAAAPDIVLDKDGISAALLVAARAAQLKADGGKTLLDRLDELAAEHGVHLTDQVSIRVNDLSLIGTAMSSLRASPPVELLGRAVGFEDLAPDADVVRLRGDGLRVVVRPSGTEPKLKAYLEIVVAVTGSVAAARDEAAALMSDLRTEVSALMGFPT